MKHHPCPVSIPAADHAFRIFGCVPTKSSFRRTQSHNKDSCVFTRMSAQAAWDGVPTHWPVLNRSFANASWCKNFIIEYVLAWFAIKQSLTTGSNYLVKPNKMEGVQRRHANEATWPSKSNACELQNRCDGANWRQRPLLTSQSASLASKHWQSSTPEVKSYFILDYRAQDAKNFHHCHLNGGAGAHCFHQVHLMYEVKRIGFSSYGRRLQRRTCQSMQLILNNTGQLISNPATLWS